MPDRETGEGRWSDERLFEGEVVIALKYLETRVTREAARDAASRDNVVLHWKAWAEAERRQLETRR